MNHGFDPTAFVINLMKENKIEVVPINELEEIYGKDNIPQQLYNLAKDQERERKGGCATRNSARKKIGDDRRRQLKN